MNRSDLIKMMASKSGLTQVQCKTALRQLESAICQALHEGETVYLPNFGVFEIRYQLPRTGRNPQTGEAIEIPFQTSAAFKPATKLKRAITC